MSDEPGDLIADPTAAIVLTSLARDAKDLNDDQFRALHGSAFLLHDGELDPQRRAYRPQQTMVMRRDPTAEHSDVPPQTRNLLVYPVKHTGRSPFPRIVTVGRTKNNDIVLADVSISKFHAFFKEEGGQFLLSDGESRNGSFVEGERVPSSKQGKPVPLVFGKKVKFGALEFRFVDAAELRTLVRYFS
jgi:pSer/pThr/pTyr-binding forkhead associated (FHA) protein